MKSHVKKLRRMYWNRGISTIRKYYPSLCQLSFFNQCTQIPTCLNWNGIKWWSLPQRFWAWSLVVGIHETLGTWFYYLSCRCKNWNFAIIWSRGNVFVSKPKFRRFKSGWGRFFFHDVSAEYRSSRMGSKLWVPIPWFPGWFKNVKPEKHVPKQNYMRQFTSCLPIYKVSEAMGL